MDLQELPCDVNEEISEPSPLILVEPNPQENDKDEEY
jgi:hypothetical protein